MIRPSMLPLALLLTLGSATLAAPNIPSSELPGRDRLRFQDTPIDRFIQPAPKAQPLWRWDCDRPKGKSARHDRNISKRC